MSASLYVIEDSLAQLACRAPREGDRQCAPRRDAVVQHGGREALDKDARLARAGGRRDDQRAGPPLDRVELRHGKRRAHVPLRQIAGYMQPPP